MKPSKIFLTLLVLFTLTIMTSIASSATKFETLNSSVPVWSSYSSKSTLLYRIPTVGTLVDIVDAKVNSYGNTWFKTASGSWIFSENIKKCISELRVVNLIAPSSLIPKQTYSISGQIMSNYTITSVTTGVYDLTGKLITGVTHYPKLKLYDLKTADPYVKFNSLQPGDYQFKIIATDLIGTKILKNLPLKITYPVFPVPGYSYGSCGLNCTCKYHLGIHNGRDISTYSAKPEIVASHSGTVEIVSSCKYDDSRRYCMPDCLCGNKGNCVRIVGDGVITTYMHLADISVLKGQKVTAGQVIGHIGSTGDSTGNHLHFEMRINGKLVDPINYTK